MWAELAAQCRVCVSQHRDICAPCPCLASPPAHFASRKCHRESNSHQNYMHLNSFLEIAWAQPPVEMRWHRTD